MLHQIRGHLRRATTNFLNGTSGGLAFAPALPTELDPLSAPDADYWHYITPQIAARYVIAAGAFTTVYSAKNGAASPQYNFGAVPGLGALDTGSINGLQAAFFNKTLVKRWAIDPSIAAAGEFMYPSMTWFFVLRPEGALTNHGFVVSDYGNVINKLCYLKIGNGTNFQVTAALRDGAGNAITVTSGATFLSVNTDYLIVCKMDGANKRVDFWIDGAVNFNGTNAAYDPTTTWEGKVTPTAVPTIGALSDSITQPFNGDMGAIFLTKTALSNADINLYANYLAGIWGTAWTNI